MLRRYSVQVFCGLKANVLFADNVPPSVSLFPSISDSLMDFHEIR